MNKSDTNKRSVSWRKRKLGKAGVESSVDATVKNKMSKIDLIKRMTGKEPNEAYIFGQLRSY